MNICEEKIWAQFDSVFDQISISESLQMKSVGL